MNNNDVLRKLRYAFDFSDSKMIELFAEGDLEVSRAEVSNWLKREEDQEFVSLNDKQLAIFLNGFIIDQRGRREGPQPVPEKTLNNNIVFRKIKIALNLTDTDILDIYALMKMRISKHEISALFRKPGQNQYRKCKDQFLRNFLHGLQRKYRNSEDGEE